LDRVMISYRRMGASVISDAMPVETFIELVVSQIPGFSKGEVRQNLYDRLAATIQEDDLAAIDANWRDCASKTEKVGVSGYFRQHADFLRDLVCKETNYPGEVAAGVIKNWIPRNNPSRRDFASILARGLLGLDGNRCAATKALTDEDKERLWEFAAPPPVAN
jgi:hypothetical protein